MFLCSWEQNFDLQEVDIYKDSNNAMGEFCVARAGFAEFALTFKLSSTYQELRTCINTCSDPKDCVIITNHSQGGASTIIESILVYSLMPTTVTFGMPPALQKDCTLVHLEHFYRFVNFRQEDNEKR